MNLSRPVFATLAVEAGELRRQLAAVGTAVLAGLLLLGPLAPYTIFPSGASHVAPELVSGNPTCADFGGENEFKIEGAGGVQSGTYTQGPLTVTVTKHDTSSGETFDWTSNIGIDAVVVKGGPSANLYRYDGETADAGLHSPVVPSGRYAELSHISFCYDDVIEPEYAISLAPEAEDNLIRSPHLFTVTVTRTDTDTPVEGVNPEVAIVSGPGELTDDGCADVGTDSDGECTVTLTSSEVGQTVLQATFEGEIDQTQVDLTSNEATKDWVDYAIDVTPPDAVNPTGTTHEFIVELTRLDPDNPSGAPAGGEDVDLTLDGVGEIVEIDGNAASGTTGTCTTASDGTCSVVITSDDVGNSTLTATFDAAVGGTSGEFSDSGDKEWRQPGILLVKNAEIEPNEEGDKVIECTEEGCPETTFTFTVTNTGDVDLTITDLVDDKFGSITLADTELEPGDSTQGTATYTPSEADIDAGLHENLAVVTAVTEDDQTLTDEDDEVVVIVEVFPREPEDRPAIEVVKNAEIIPDGDGRKVIECTEEGCPETTFTFTVTNTGETPLSDVTVTDDKFGEITLSDTTLAPGDSTVGVATYVPTEAEIDAGLHENLAVAEGIPPEGPAVSDDDDERVDIIEVLPREPEEPPVHPRTGPTHLILLLALGGMSIAAGAGSLFVRRHSMT